MANLIRSSWGLYTTKIVPKWACEPYFPMLMGSIGSVSKRVNRQKEGAKCDLLCDIFYAKDPVRCVLSYQQRRVAIREKAKFVREGVVVYLVPILADIGRHQQ